MKLTLSEAIKVAAGRQGLTQTDLAEASGLSKSTICNCYAGTASSKAMCAAAKALGLNPQDHDASITSPPTRVHTYSAEGAALQAVMRKRGLRRKDVCKRLGMGSATISALHKGRYSQATRSKLIDLLEIDEPNLEKLAKTLEVV